MTAPATTPVWDLEGPYGAERWSGEPGHYTEVWLDNEPVSLDPGEGELEFLRTRASACVHQGPWPYAFNWCPHCGKELLPPSPAKAAETWSSVGNAATGLPGATARGTPDVTQRGETPMPGPSRLDFVVAGTPSRLLALDQTTMALYSWKDTPSGSFTANRWRELTRIHVAATLPRWSWGIAATAYGLALPTDAGPVWLSLQTRGVRTSGPDPASGVQRSLGGAVTVAGRTLVPVLAKGILAIAAWLPDEGRWDVSPVENAPDDAGAQTFAAPSANPFEAFWVGASGQLFVRLEGGRLQCFYRPWSDGWAPMLAVRPVLSPNGVFHQLGRQEAAQSFEALIPPGGTPQRRSFDRFVLSGGTVSFGGMNRYREPWEERRIEYRDRAGGSIFIAPLLAFSGERHLVAACSPRQALLPFIETNSEREENVECRVMLAGASLVPDDLATTLRARHVWELVPFIYAQTLFVYELQGNRCFHWPLKDLHAA